MDGNLTLSGLDCTANANGRALTADASGVVSCSDDDGGAAGNTLDAAYDQGGAGVGRTITPDSGAVEIAGSGGLELDTGNLFQTPGDPVSTGSLGSGGGPTSVYVSGRYAYVVDTNSDDLKVIDISGAEVTSLIAHSLEAGNLQVRNDMIAQGQLQVSGGLNVGAGGIFSDGDVGIDGSLQIVGTVAIKDAAVTSTSIADGVQLYAETRGLTLSSELKVLDEAGNVTVLSPHNFSLIGEPSEAMAWSFYSENEHGKINVDMLKTVCLVEALSGEKLVHIQSHDESEMENSREYEASLKAQVEPGL